MADNSNYRLEAVIKVAGKVGMPATFIDWLKHNNRALSELLDKAKEYSEERMRDATIMLAADKNFTNKVALAYHESIDPKALEILARHPGKYVRASVASNPLCPQSVQLLLYKDTSLFVKICLCFNKSTVAEVLHQWVLAGVWELFPYIAKHPNVTSENLHVLSTSHEPEVRAAVASNPNASAGILEVLSHDESWLVRRNVAENERASKKVLERLIGDKNRLVKTAASQSSKKRGK